MKLEKNVLKHKKNNCKIIGRHFLLHEIGNRQGTREREGSKFPEASASSKAWRK